MPTEETREQQQMYNTFRSCIYLFLILELFMNLPVTSDNPLTKWLLELISRFRVFNSVTSCKVMELICIGITCIGTRAKKSLKFNMKTMVIYPTASGVALIFLCIWLHYGQWGGYMASYPVNRCLYALCSVLGTMLVHQGLDAIARYYNMKVGEDRFNFGNETYIDIQIVTLYLYLFLVNFWLNLGVWQREFRGKKEGSNRRTTMQKTPFGRSVRILCKDR